MYPGARLVTLLNSIGLAFLLSSGVFRRVSRQVMSPNTTTVSHMLVCNHYDCCFKQRKWMTFDRGRPWSMILFSMIFVFSLLQKSLSFSVDFVPRATVRRVQDDIRHLCQGKTTISQREIDEGSSFVHQHEPLRTYGKSSRKLTSWKTIWVDTLSSIKNVTI